jgi:hypothetical protein
LGVLLQCEAKGYGIEAEQVAKISENGLRVREVPTRVRYKGLGKTSKKNPVRHGSELVGMALRLVAEDRPLLVLGLPGFVAVLFGVTAGTLLLLQFNATRIFSIPLALIAMGTFFTGTLLLISSLILYAITRLKSEPLKRINI